MQRLNDVRLYEVDDLNYPQTEVKDFPKHRLSGELELKHVSFGGQRQVHGGQGHYRAL